MAAEKFYVAAGTPDGVRGLVVTAGPPSDGSVRFSLAGAGIVSSLTEARFAADFREMTDAEVAGLAPQLRIRKGDVCVPRDGGDLVVTVSSIGEGKVAFHTVGGGFEKSGPIERFDQEFRRETADETRMRLAYAKGSVRLDSFEADEHVPAWLNGARWNGYAVPTFEASDLHAAVEQGLLPYVHYSETGDFFVTVLEQGDTLPEYDFEALRPRLDDLAGRGERYMEIEIGGNVAEFHIHPGRDVETAEGAVVRTYDVGAMNLGWMRCEAPAHSSRPSA